MRKRRKLTTTFRKRKRIKCLGTSKRVAKEETGRDARNMVMKSVVKAKLRIGNKRVPLLGNNFESNE